MKRVLARFAALVLAFSFALPSTALASTLNDRREINRAAVEIAAMMQNIMDNYMGEITVQELYEAALHGIASVLDEHSSYISPGDLAAFERTYFGRSMAFGIMYFLNSDGRIEIENVVPGSPAADADISRGDIITRIDGVDVDSGNYEFIFTRLANPELQSATFDIYSDGVTRRVPLTKGVIELPTVHAELASAHIPDAPDHVGYILIESFTLNTAYEMFDALADFRRHGITHLILDLRYNPGGDRDAVTDISRMLVPEGVIYSTVDRRGRGRPVHSRLRNSPFAHMVVLTNSHSASASELLALALSESGAATIVGQRTFGKGSIQTVFPLMRGDYFIFTTMEYFGRNGTRINNIGVAPDVEVNIPVYLNYQVVLDGNNSSHRMPDVKRLLQFLGYPIGPMDTFYDDITRMSIVQIQQYHGLTPDGDINTDTALTLDMLLHRQLRRDDVILQQGFEVLMES